MQTKFRHEWKHRISHGDRLLLCSRLQAVMQPDPHAVGGCYKIRSLYFDDSRDTALLEKLNGVNIREKFRIRYYNDDLSFIRLEKSGRRQDRPDDRGEAGRGSRQDIAGNHAADWKSPVLLAASALVLAAGLFFAIKFKR